MSMMASAWDAGVSAVQHRRPCAGPGATRSGPRIGWLRQRPTIAVCRPTEPSEGPNVKPYDIEVLRLKSMKHEKGMIEINVDALVSTLPLRDEQAATSCLRLPVEHARTLLILLKQQIAELDKLQPRSRRSGRC